MNRTNLIPLHHRRAAAQSDRIFAWCIAGAVELLLLAGVTCVMLLGDGQTLPATAEVARIEQESTRQIDLAKQANLALVAARHVQASNQRFADQPDWSALLVTLADTLGDDAQLNKCEAVPAADSNSTAKPQAAGYVVHLAGSAKSQATVAHVVLRLERLGVFDRVEFLQSTSQPTATLPAGVSFAIDCIIDLAPPAKPAVEGAR